MSRASPLASYYLAIKNSSAISASQPSTSN
jgi:hypothetical protein